MKIDTMITRPTLIFIGVAAGLLFLLISIHNSRRLNTDLMAKLVETEVNQSQSGRYKSSKIFCCRKT